MVALMARSTLASKPALALVGVLGALGISSSARTQLPPDVVASHLAPRGLAGLHASVTSGHRHAAPSRRRSGPCSVRAAPRPYDEAALRLALDALTAERKDSDDDGTPDIDELRAGDDPNSGAGGPAVTPD